MATPGRRPGAVTGRVGRAALVVGLTAGLSGLAAIGGTSVATAANPTPTLTLAGNPIPGNNSYDVTLTVPSGGPAPTESVAVSDGAARCAAALSNPSADGITFTGTCTLDGETSGEVVGATYDADGFDTNYSELSSNSLTVGGPVVVAGATATFDGGGSPVDLDPGLTVTDASSTTLAGATVVISSGSLTGDTLSAPTEPGISATYTPTTSTLLLSGNASLATYQSALDGVSYAYNGDPTDGGTDAGRTVTWTVNDGTVASTPVTSTLDTVQVGTVTCASGDYLPSGQSNCVPAGLGNYVAPGSTTETPCAAGTFQSESGQTSCIQTSPGYYSQKSAFGAIGPIVEVACNLGQYQPQSGQSSCLEASPGYYVSSQGSTTETECPLGTWSTVKGAAFVSSCTAVGGPSAQINSPGTVNTYAVGATVPTSFSCGDASNAPGLASCDDNNGTDTVAGGAGTLDTTVPGPGTYTVTAISIDGQAASASIGFTVSDTVGLTNPGLQSATEGTAITPLPIAATDSSSVATLSYSASGLPPGLSISASTGVISGTPSTVAGSPYSVSVTATDDYGFSGSTAFVWDVAAPDTVSLTNPGSQKSVTGTAVNLQLAGSDNEGQTVTYSATGLPSGLSISPSGLVGGTPTTAGTFTAQVTAKDGLGTSASASFTWTVVPATTLTLVAVPGGTVPSGLPVAYGVLVSTGSARGTLTGTVSFTANGAAIPGCSNLHLILGLTGCVTSFASAGSYAVVASYSGDPNFGSSSAGLTETVDQFPAITSAAATTATVGKSGTFQVTATGTPAPTFTESGALPKGVTLSSAGLLSGTPAAGTGGVYPITIVATNAVGAATQKFTLTVDQPPAITSAASASATVGKAVSFQMTATGTPAPTFTESGALPKGVTLSSAGLLSGTPAAGTAGTYTVTVTATSSAGTAQQSFTLKVAS